MAAMERAQEPFQGAKEFLERLSDSLGGMEELWRTPLAKLLLPAKYHGRIRDDAQAMAVVRLLAKQMKLSIQEPDGEFWRLTPRQFREMCEAQEGFFSDVTEHKDSAEQDMPTLVARFKAARRTAGHSQAKAAEKMCVGTDLVARFEQGRTTPRNDNLKEIHAYIERHEKPSKSPVKA